MNKSITLNYGSGYIFPSLAEIDSLVPKEAFVSKVSPGIEKDILEITYVVPDTMDEALDLIRTKRQSYLDTKIVWDKQQVVRRKLQIIRYTGLVIASGILAAVSWVIR